MHHARDPGTLGIDHFAYSLDPLKTKIYFFSLARTRG